MYIVGMSAERVNALRSARSELLRCVHMGEQLLSELVSNSVITKAMKDVIDVSNRY